MAMTMTTVDTSPAYETAVMLARLGVSVIPIAAGTKEPPRGIRWGEYTQRMADASELYQWYIERGYQLGVVCGPISGNLVVIDFDGADDDGGYAAWAERWPAIDALPRARTGRGRVHVYLRSSTPTDKYTVIRDGQRVEVRSGNHYVVAPPSVHPDTGEAYIWSQQRPIEGGIPVIDLASIGLETRRKTRLALVGSGSEGDALAEAEIAQLIDLVTPSWIEGQRHNLALALSGWLAGYNVPEADTLRIVDELSSSDATTDRRDYLTTVSTTYNRWRDGIAVAGWSMLIDEDAPLLPRGTAKRLEGVLRDRQTTLEFAVALGARRHPDDEDAAERPIRALTDTGNAERLIDQHGDDLRYVRAWNSWLYWTGTYWRRDDTGEVERRAKQTAVAIAEEATRVPDDEYKQTLRHAMKSQSAQSRRNMIQLAESEDAVATATDVLNRDPWLLTVRNGTLDLRTGELREHRREDMMTRSLNVVWDASATCPTWQAFLDEITAGRPELVAFLQRAIGYSLTGDVRERAMFILHGAGANGKSTLLDVLRELLGEYAMRLPAATLMTQRGETIPNDIARLQGCRLAFASETDEGRRLSEALVKSLTGNDVITARFMRGEWFDFKPEFKLWLATNHRPEIRGTDRAIWDRIRLVPFDVSIPEAKQNRGLLQELLDELPGILAWAVEGCLAWQRDGLGMPAAVRAATDGYRLEQDVLAAWMADCCELLPGVMTLTKDLYESYRAWCEQNGEKYLNSRQLAKRLSERGFEPRRATGGGRGWAGIKLVTLPAQSDISDAVFQVNAKKKNPRVAYTRNCVTNVTNVTRAASDDYVNADEEDDDDPDF